MMRLEDVCVGTDSQGTKCHGRTAEARKVLATRRTARLRMGGRQYFLAFRAVPIHPEFTMLLLLSQMSVILHPAESSAAPASSDMIMRRALAPLRNMSSSHSQSAAIVTAHPAGAPRASMEPIILITHTGLIQAFRLPANTFSEPLDKLHISITLWNGSALPHDYWLSFWPTDHMVVVRSDRSDVGTHDLLLRAVSRSFKGYGAGTVAAELTCLRVIVEETLDGVLTPAAGASQSSRFASTELTMACHPPAVSNQPPRATVSSLLVSADRGKELRYDLPDSLFSDEEDGVMRHLNIQLFRVDCESRSPTVTHVSPSSPLQLVSARDQSHYLSGLYWKPVIRSTLLCYVLRAADREGAYADVSVQFNITEPPVPPAFLFRAQLSVDWSSFSNDVMRQLDFLLRVAHVVGDSGTVNVSLLDVRQPLQSSTPLSILHRLQRRSPVDLKQASTVLVSWTHTVLVSASVASVCPAEAIQSLSRRFMANNVITAVATDKQHGLGSFGVISIELIPHEHCLNKVPSGVATQPVVSLHFVEAACLVGMLILAIVVIAALIGRRHNRIKLANASGSTHGKAVSETMPVMWDDGEGGGESVASKHAVPLTQNVVTMSVSSSPPEYACLVGSGNS